MGGVTVTNPSLVKFQALKSSADELALQLQEVKVTDEVTEAFATQIVSKAREFEKIIDKKRVELKAPSLQEGKDIDSAAKFILDELSKALAPAKKEILTYKEKVENARLAEMHRLNSLKIELSKTKIDILRAIDNARTPEDLKALFVSMIKPFKGEEHWKELSGDAAIVLQEVKAYGSAKKAAMLNPEKLEEAKALQADIVQNLEVVTETAGEEVIAETEMAKSSGMRTTWKHELVDITKVPAEWLMLDDAKVKAWLKQAREGGMMETETIKMGVRFYPEKSLVVK